MRKESTDTNTKLNQILELCCKDFKAAVIKTLQWSIIKIPERHEKIEILSKETEIIKIQMEIVELKDTITEIKNSLGGLKVEWK